MAQSQKKVDGGRIGGPVVIPGCVEVMLLWTLPNTRLAATVLHGRNLGSFVPSVALANTMFSALAGSWNTNLGSYIATTVTFRGMSLRDMSASTNPAFQSTAATTSGSSASPALPPQTAIVLSGKGLNRGKGNSARAYLPGFATNADSGGGVVLPALVTALGTFANGLYNNFTSNGLQPAVAHPARQAYTGITGTQHPQRNASTADIQSWILRDNIFDTVRARVKP